MNMQAPHRIYWLDECKYCVNAVKPNLTKCEYMDQMIATKNKMKETLSGCSGIYFSFNMYCDYFFCDAEKYYKDNPPVTCG